MSIGVYLSVSLIAAVIGTWFVRSVSRDTMSIFEAACLMAVFAIVWPVFVALIVIILALLMLLGVAEILLAVWIWVYNIDTSINRARAKQNKKASLS